MKGLALVLLGVLLGMSSPVRAAETLRFVTEEFAPFNATEDDRLVGPGIDVARALCSGLGVDCTFEALPLRRAIEMVEAGKADGVFSLAHTPDRDTTMRFTQPYIRSGYAFFTLKNQNHAAAMRQDFAGFTVAAYGPSGTYSSLEAVQHDVPSLQLVQEVAFETPFLKLIEGRYPEPAAVYANWHVGLRWLQEHQVQNVTVSFPEKFIDYCYAFSRRSPEAQRHFAGFDAALGAMRRDGRLLALISAYDFGEADLPPKE
jgi:polar amino acid transport system substrate-binding protein